MSKRIKNCLNQGYSEPVPDRLWYRIQNTIYVQKKRGSFLSFYKLVAVAAVFIFMIGIYNYQQHMTYTLVNNYLYEELVIMDLSVEGVSENSNWGIDDILGTL